MRYAVLLYQDERVWTEATAEQREAYHAAHRAFDEAARARAEVYGGEALTSMVNATTLRHDTDGNRLVTDGPFAETIEQLGGFYLVEAPDLDTLTDLCDLLPHAYAIEMRPVADMSNDEDWLDAAQT
jgi:hypothetical protein